MEKQNNLLSVTLYFNSLFRRKRIIRKVVLLNPTQGLLVIVTADGKTICYSINKLDHYEFEDEK